MSGPRSFLLFALGLAGAGAGCSDSAPPAAGPTAAEWSALKEERAQLERTVSQLRADLEATRAALKDLEARVRPPDVPPPPPPPPKPGPIKGMVLAADAKTGVYLVSVGSRDGLKAGDELVVYRGDTYVATVVVDKAMADKASIVVKRTSDGTAHQASEIRQGDRVGRSE